MIFKTEKYKKDVRDVMLFFLYLGFILVMFSSIIRNSTFGIDVQIIGIFFLEIGYGMGVIIAYFFYSNKKHTKKKPKFSLERMLVLHVFLGIVLLFLTLILISYIRFGIL